MQKKERDKFIPETFCRCTREEEREIERDNRFIFYEELSNKAFCTPLHSLPFQRRSRSPSPSPPSVRPSSVSVDGVSQFST